MSIRISYTDKGEIIYDGDGKIWLAKGSRKKVLKMCDLCGKIRWIIYRQVIESRMKNNGKDYCHKCSIKQFWNGKTREDLEEIRRKTRETSLKKYGVEHPAKSRLCQEKKRKTVLEKYGVDCVFQSKEVKQKIRQTNIERLGVDSPLKNIQVMAKREKTSIKRYGFVNPMKSESVSIKFREKKIQIGNDGGFVL